MIMRCVWAWIIALWVVTAGWSASPQAKENRPPEPAHTQY